MIRMAGGCTYTCRPNIIRRQAGWGGTARQRDGGGAYRHKQADSVGLNPAPVQWSKAGASH